MSCITKQESGFNQSETIFRKRYFHISYRRRMLATLIGQRQSIGASCQGSEMVTQLNSLSFMFKISFLPKYRVKYDGLYCKVAQWDTNN